MLKPSRSHQDYADFVRRETRTLSILKRHYPAKGKLLLLDLTLIIPILAVLYAAGGRPAVPPEDLLRSLIAMMLCGYTSITRWVELMRQQPYYAIISGFDPADVPGIGTFYDFMDRLLSLKFNKTKHLIRRKRKRKQTKKDKQAAKDKNKDTPKHQGIINRLAKHYLFQATQLPAEWRFDESRFSRTEGVLKRFSGTVFVSAIRSSGSLGQISCPSWP